MIRAVVRAAVAPERRCFLLLLFAFALLFATASGRPQQLDSMNSAMSLEYLTIAENRSPEHGFVGFRRQFLNKDGERAYEPYNRFPIAGYLAIKAVLLAFHDDMPAQVQAARALMLAFFAAAMLAAYFSLKRLTTSPSVALAATLLGFSSYYTLGIADMIATEGAMELFAVMLTFHGLVVFVQQGRFAQLLAKSCIAVLIGWHVFALLLPFIVFGLAVEWWRSDGDPLRRAGRLLRSRHVALGAVALSVGVSMLALNFVLERKALPAGNEPLGGAETTLAQLPSYQSMLRRMGWDSRFNARHSITLASTAKSSFDYAGRAFIPYAAEGAARAVLEFGNAVEQSAAAGSPSASAEAATGVPSTSVRMSPNERQGAHVVAAPAQQQTSSLGRTAATDGKKTRSLMAATVRFLGLLLSVATAVAIAFAHQRVLLAALAVVGFCWCLLVPGFAFAPQEGKFFVGTPLVLYALVSVQAQRRSQGLVNGCVVLAMLIFALSALRLPFASNAPGVDAVSELASDKQAIHAIAPKQATIVAKHSIEEDYLLTGRIVSSFNNQQTAGELVLADRMVGDAGLLTPDNRFYFLYERGAYDAAMSRRREESEPSVLQPR